MQPEVAHFGLDLTQLLIENISLPPEVETALDKRTSMGIVGNMQQYAQFQAANAIEASAQNPGGGTPALDFGVGLAMGQQLMTAFSPATPATSASPASMMPPPPPVQSSAVQWHLSRDGQTLGPMTLEQLLQTGMTADTYLWCPGMAEWQRAAAIPEVAARLGQIPPPPPVS